MRESSRHQSGKTIYDYFHQAVRRPGNTLTDLRSVVLFGEEGTCAAFELRHCEGKISEVRFKCTTCFTLVALCEHIAELAAGMSVAEAQEISPERLLELHPEVPMRLANRANLATMAFRAALRNTTGKS